MSADLLERETELSALASALEDAQQGRGGVVLVSGEAGIGKSSVIRAFLETVPGRVRMLTGACEDLLTPRALGPLRDAVRHAGSALAAALTDGDQDAVLSAVYDELADPRPTVLVVEDAHWADEATLDVLRFAGRRIADLPALLVVTYRDDEPGLQRLQRVLGALGGRSVHRLALRPLSRNAVARWSDGTRITSAALYTLTGGNPFFVSEVLAAGPGAVPATVVDAVLARLQRLDGRTLELLDRLAVVPARVELPLARALVGELRGLAEAERAGLLAVDANAVTFRHELARRAVVDALPVSRRMQLNELVLIALQEQDAPDPARLVHHAVEAAHDAAVIRHAPEAARLACAAGAQGQGAALYAEVLRRGALLSTADRAEICQARAWALFHANRRGEAVRAAEDAVQLRDELSDPGQLGWALAFAAMQQWVNLEIDAARESAERALEVLEPVGDSVEHASSLAFLAVLFIVLDREQEGLDLADRGLAMAERLSLPPLRPLGLLYRGRGRMQLGDRGGLDDVLAAMELARGQGRVDDVMMGYLSLVPLLWREGRFAEAAHHLDRWTAESRNRDFLTHDQTREAYTHSLTALRGDWAAADRGLRTVLAAGDDPGVLGRHAVPALARLAVRQGSADADTLLAEARTIAERAGSFHVLAQVAVIEAEWAWLTDRPELADLARQMLPDTVRSGRERQRGELLRYLRRLGDPVEPFQSCPEEFAAGLRGDWRAAAAAWERIGDNYERALELGVSGERGPTLEALALLDRLGAKPAAALVRRTLRNLGVRQVPRGPRMSTRTNLAGLTDRQLEILDLLGDGLTNAEIAARLVVSVRTVDHHVSAVLQKLGVATRREAAALALADLSGATPR